MRKSHEDVSTTIVVALSLAICLSLFVWALASSSSSTTQPKNKKPIVLITPTTLVTPIITIPTTTLPPTTTTTTPYVAPTTTTVPVAPPTPAPAPAPAPPAPVSVPTTSSGGVTPAEYAAWTKVAVCEEGGWIGYAGPAYPDSLGINAANWIAYGGTSDLSPSAQIIVAERIQSNPPDQNGCAAW